MSGEANGSGAAAAAEADRVPFTGGPDPAFEVLAARAVEHAAAPTISFRIRATDDSQRQVFTIALSVLITIEPAKRSYDDASRERLVELFGAPERWATTTTNFRWAQVDVLVPGFSGATEFELALGCTYDLEVASAKYFHGLAEGEAPLRFHFNGTVYYEADEGRLQIVQLPWDRSARFRMPVEAWRQTIDAHYPYRGWVPLHADTLRRLERRKAERALPTFDAALDELLDIAGTD